ncbi:helicase [Leptotrichia sp. OH3620_COT-345]|uniref:PBECR3 domain-containing polyvalent protein n=1 Tax=Leptotrichia sp. OH3620_COT-345 TaxID=2491048 RepID=UPI000F6485BF|nr:helicase [Leptotrichia sp. OH3620_COT-345]RRD40914.1 helicase [Leptotrichia sp. OH3620_COT-345]
MEIKIRYTKTGKKIEIYKFYAKLHTEVILNKKQFEEHILKKHSNITLEIISNVLINPDYVTKRSNSKKEHFYQKKIEKNYYFVVVSNQKNVRRTRFILTAFSVDDINFLKEKNIYYKYIRDSKINL